MSGLLLLVIRLYWALWPARWRRRCLYRESCSRHVYRVTREGGFARGIRALRKRAGSCRPGYGVFQLAGQPWVLLADGSVLSASEASPVVLRTAGE